MKKLSMHFPGLIHNIQGLSRTAKEDFGKHTFIKIKGKILKNVTSVRQKPFFLTKPVFSIEEQTSRAQPLQMPLIFRGAELP